MEYPLTPEGLARAKADGFVGSPSVSCRAAMKRLQAILAYCENGAVPDEKGARETIPDGLKKGMTSWESVQLPENLRTQADEIRRRAIELLQELPCLTEDELRDLERGLVEEVGAEIVTYEQAKAHIEAKEALLASRPSLTMEQVRPRLDGIEDLVRILRENFAVQGREHQKSVTSKAGTNSGLVRQTSADSAKLFIRSEYEKERKRWKTREATLVALAKKTWDFEPGNPDAVPKKLSLSTVRKYTQGQV